MGNVVGIGSNIVNPMARPVLTLTVNEHMQVDLQCQLPPEQVIKCLQSVITDVTFLYLQKMIKESTGPNLQ